ncbi:hypothetical protein N7541_010386 [Penicillium brevicompactum]|uniref:Uncharacterized protein n=1 Tax=Penicillium brevicompactum TaxID=5074 RepID=A0A9W9QNB8_PENBR|nr:hypothetical protein N7541_010386 [Penicillium brevicompactum]
MEPELPQSESNTASDYEQFDAESNDLKNGKQICQGAIKREEAAGCANPTPWVDGDPIPTSSAPKPGIIASDRWDANCVNWAPDRVRLTDAGCIFAILTMSATERGDLLPFDFDKHGQVRLTKDPQPTTVVVTQQNLRLLLAWRDTYVFTGGHNNAGWLLNSQYPKELASGRYSKGWLRAGLVLAPLDVASSSVSTKTKQDFAPNDETNASTWEYGWAIHGIPLLGHRKALDASDASQRHTTWQELTNMEHFYEIQSSDIPPRPKKQKISKEGSADDREDTEDANIDDNLGTPKSKDPTGDNEDTGSHDDLDIIESIERHSSPNDPFSSDAHVDDTPHMWTSTHSTSHKNYLEPLLFSTVLNVVRVSGKPNHPRIMRRLSALEVARQAIWSDRVAYCILCQRMSAHEREFLVNWLFPLESDTTEEARQVMDGVSGDSPRHAALYDALHYWDNVDWLRERIENLQDWHTTEAKCYRSLIEHFGSPPTVHN